MRTRRVRRALKALFARNAPFSIRPRLDPGLWRWLWNFGRKCNRRDMLAGATALHALLQSSMALFEQLVTNEPIECEWEQRGLLFVYRDREPFDAYERTNRLLTETFSEPAEKLAAGELQRLEPALKALGAASLPLGLLCIGAALEFRSVRQWLGPVVSSSALKFLAMPVATILVAMLTGLKGPALTTAVLFQVLPTASSAYIMARQLGGDAPLMAGITATQTVLALAAIPLVLISIHSILPF